MILEGIVVPKDEYEELKKANKCRLNAIKYIEHLLKIEDSAEVQFKSNTHLTDVLTELKGK